MRYYPLLDLDSAWQDAEKVLEEIMDLAEALYDGSGQTWYDMLIVRGKALHAKSKLGVLPAAILESIAKDWADLEEAEAHAPENINGY